MGDSKEERRGASLSCVLFKIESLPFPKMMKIVLLVCLFAPVAISMGTWKAEEFETCAFPSPKSDLIDCLQLTPIPGTYTKQSDMPPNFDYRFHNGQNLLTPTLNQHIPTYCGACWAFAPLSAVSDRIKIARNGAWPEIVLSPQVLLNCAEKTVGSPMGCHGGFMTRTMQYLHSSGRAIAWGSARTATTMALAWRSPPRLFTR